MKFITEESKSLPIYAQTDVIVVGGGPSGIAAALSAARNGVDVILIETMSCLGGQQVLAINPTMSTVDRRIQGGIPQEIYDRLHNEGAAYISTEEPHKNYPFSKREGYMYFDSQYYKKMLEDMIVKAGIRIMYFSTVCGVLKTENTLQGVIVETPQGRLAVMGKVIIDCSGSAEVIWRADDNCLFNDGLPDNYYAENKGMSLLANSAILRNIDYSKEEIRKFDDHTPVMHINKDIITSSGSADADLVNCSIALFEFPNGRGYMLSPTWIVPNGRHLWDVDVLTEATIGMRKQAFAIKNYLNSNVAGFERAEIEELAHIHCRIFDRRMKGEYILTGNDIHNPELYFEDAIAVSNMTSDFWYPTGNHTETVLSFDVLPYEVPYRILKSTKYDNLLAAGTNASMDPIAGQAMRYVTPSMSTGQAAGTAAAVAIKDGVSTKKVDVAKVQRALKAQNVIVSRNEIDESVIQEYRDRNSYLASLKTNM